MFECLELVNPILSHLTSLTKTQFMSHGLAMSPTDPPVYYVCCGSPATFLHQFSGTAVGSL